MTTFAPVALPHIAPPDPSKHVNYELGMVLGVDDFTQEFSYLSERDRRIARDLVGYGVISGLRVTIGAGADDRGPRLQVSPGGLVTPAGQLVCISPAQCAYLDEWLRANRQAIPTPAPSRLHLSVVACYRECETDDVPIPGEPCRSEEELMKPSRVQDSFALELRLERPSQSEEDAVRAWVAWVRRIPVVDDVQTDLAGFRRTLEQATSEPSDGPPADRLAFLKQPPPDTLRIVRSGATAYYEAAFDRWVSDLRARARSGGAVAECGCCGGPGALDGGSDCLEIATIDIPIAPDDATGDLRVVDPSAIAIDDVARANLLHLRMLQEWLLSMEPAPPVVPSGLVQQDGTVLASVGGLEARVISEGLYHLTYPGFDKGTLQLVTGEPLVALKSKGAMFEVIAPDDPDLAALVEALADRPPDGVVVRVTTSRNQPVPGGFTVSVEAKGTL